MRVTVVRSRSSHSTARIRRSDRWPRATYFASGSGLSVVLREFPQHDTRSVDVESVMKSKVGSSGEFALPRIRWTGTATLCRFRFRWPPSRPAPQFQLRNTDSHPFAGDLSPHRG